MSSAVSTVPLTQTWNVGGGGGPLRCVICLHFKLTVAVSTENLADGVVADAWQQSDWHTNGRGFQIRPPPPQAHLITMSPFHDSPS